MWGIHGTEYSNEGPLGPKQIIFIGDGTDHYGWSFVCWEKGGRQMKMHSNRLFC